MLPVTAYHLTVLSSMMNMAKMLLMTVLPLKAIELLKTEQFVSLSYFIASCIAVNTSLFVVPKLSNILPRYVVFVFGIFSLLLCLPFLATTSPGLFVVGLGLQAVGLVVLEVTTSLYAQDAFKREQFIYYEPIRLFALGAVSVIGPWAGVFVTTTFGPLMAYIASGAVVAILAVYFLVTMRRLPVRPRISEKSTTSAFMYLHEFVRQPRMRLAYVLASGRSAWWMIFFLYMPIFATKLGFSSLQAAALVSLAMMWVLAAPFWGAVARRHGTRTVLFCGYALSGVLTVGAGTLQDFPIAAIGLYVAASFALSVLDGPGNVFFLRAVRPLRRTEMTAVFATYRDTGQAATQLFLAAVLSIATIDVAIILTGIGTVVLAFISLSLPRRL